MYDRDVFQIKRCAGVHEEHLKRSAAIDCDPLPHPIDGQVVLNCWQRAYQIHGSANAEIDRVGAGARGTVAAGCVRSGVGVVDSLAQAA